MRNRHDLLQLERDANKEGAWQAKLAYAHYLLKFEPEQKENAKKYLQEIIFNDIREYITEARYLHESHFPADNKRDAVAIASLEKVKTNQNNRFQPILNRRILSSPEFQYKTIRYNYEHPSIPRNKRERLISQTIQKLETLLSSEEEITDTLRAKIYFQLIHLHIEHAQLKGQRSHLEEAKKYCQLLTKDETLSRMNKTAYAKQIYQEISTITNKPIYDFKTHIKESFKAGREGNRIFFKYAGIFIGNMIDFSLAGMPKLVKKSMDQDFVPKGKTLPQELFKNSGFGVVFKYLGKQLGKHVVGNLVGGPIAAIAGVVFYPFEYFHQKYRTNSEIKKVAENVVNLKKDTVKKSSTAFCSDTLSTNSESIFAHNKDNSRFDKKIDYTKSELDQLISVKHESNLFPKNEKMAYAYGRVFVNGVSKQKVDASSTMLPVYNPLKV